MKTKPELSSFGLAEQDVLRYKQMLIAYLPKQAEQLKKDKKFNDSQTIKSMVLTFLFLVLVGMIGAVEGMNGFPVFTMILFWGPQVAAGISTLVSKQGGCWSFVAILLFPGAWIAMMMKQHTPETVASRVPKSDYVDPELERKMCAYIEAVNTYNRERGLPLIVETDRRWLNS